MKNTQNSSIIHCLLLAFLLLLCAPAFAETYTYDDSGRITSVTYEDESTINYSYDNAGNVTRRFADDGSRAATISTTDSVLKSVKKIARKKAVKKDKKSKKFVKKAIKHLNTALALFDDFEIVSGESEINKAIADLKKVKKEKKSVKKQIKKLQAFL